MEWAVIRVVRRARRRLRVVRVIVLKDDERDIVEEEWEI
jgi:hypothetical protein